MVLLDSWGLILRKTEEKLNHHKLWIPVKRNKDMIFILGCSALLISADMKQRHGQSGSTAEVLCLFQRCLCAH